VQNDDSLLLDCWPSVGDARPTRRIDQGDSPALGRQVDVMR
jgi:hypothetical protein